MLYNMLIKEYSILERMKTMDEYDFGLFRDDLKKAVLKLHKDKASRVATYLDCEDKQYKVIIEEVRVCDYFVD